jgi:hypothetical protein
MPPENIPNTEPSSPTSRLLLISLVFSALVTLLLAAGYLKLRAAHNQSLQAASDRRNPTPPAPPSVQLFEDDTRLKGSDAVISGTVRNISDKTLTGLSVEIELHARNANPPRKELRLVTTHPDRLNPGEEGRYQLMVPWKDFSSLKVLAVQTPGEKVCQPALQKCAAPGLARPKETTPDKPPGKRPPPAPKPRKHSPNEALNTPETADPY